MSRGKIVIRILLVDESKSKIGKYTIFVLVRLPLFVDCSGGQRKEGRDCLPCHLFSVTLSGPISKWKMYYYKRA